MDYNTAMLAVSEGAKGIDEWPGADHNPQVLEMFKAAGHDWVNDDETAWCAAFIAWCCTQIGVEHTGKLNARSYLDWGDEVAMSAAKPGDVVVFWRGHPDQWTGHVAILISINGDKVLVRGGNQGNKVSDRNYPVNRILGFRRAVEPSSARNNRPILRMGDRGPFVLDLQGQLSDLGYHLGALDNHFGPATRAAVLAFQADNSLTADGIVGRKTWQALTEASERPVAASRREITEDDLRQRGSRTIAAADVAEEAAGDASGGAKTLATVATAAGGFLGSGDAAEKLSAAEGVIDKAMALLSIYWPLIIVLVIAYVLLTRTNLLKGVAKTIRKTRVEDARSGANIAR